MAEQPVIAAAAGDLSGVALGLDFDLKHEARIIFKAATKLGGESRLRKVDAAPLEPSEAAYQGLKRWRNIDASPFRNHGNAVNGFLGRRRHGKEIIDDGRNLFPERLGAQIAQE